MRTLLTPAQPVAIGAPALRAGLWLLRCPNCQGQLAADEQELQCAPCGRSWPITDGAPHFGGTDRRPHALTTVQRQWIALHARVEGWEAALHDRLRSLDEAIYRRAVDEYRAQWRFALPLSPSSYVLDVSCGWGAVALNLAESCAFVAAADGCSAQARFVALRAQQMNRDNVIALQLGPDRQLPFAGSSFDAVVLVDVLPWVGDGEAQRTLLRRIRAVLRPGGSLFLAAANRLGARPLSRWRAGGNAHTIGGYQQLLRSASFRDFRAYALAPSHMEPFFLIPLDRHAPLAYFLRDIVGAQDFAAHFRQRGQATLYRLARMLARRIPAAILARLARPFVPSIAIVARA